MLIRTSGYASIDRTRNLLVVDNVSAGFDVWNLESETHLKSLPIAEPERFLPRHVDFVEEANAVVGGSEHGIVYVFDRKSGLLLDYLQHAQPGLVQMVAVSISIRDHILIYYGPLTTTQTTDSDDSSTIAAGSSCGTGLITVWQTKRPRESSLKRKGEIPNKSFTQTILHFLMIAAAVAFILQNFGDVVSDHESEGCPST